MNQSRRMRRRLAAKRRHVKPKALNAAAGWRDTVVRVDTIQCAHLLEPENTKLVAENKALKESNGMETIVNTPTSPERALFGSEQLIYARRASVEGPDFIVDDGLGAVAFNSPFDPRDERGFCNMATALKSLGISAGDYVLVGQQGCLPSYFVVNEMNEHAYGPLHTYKGACRHAHSINLGLRKDFGGLLPAQLMIRWPSGKVEKPLIWSHLGPHIEQIFTVKRDIKTPSARRPPAYVLKVPKGGAAIWCGDNPYEEYWESHELMLLAMGLRQSDLEPAVRHDLPVYSIVRPEEAGCRVVVEPYHSIAHAARMALVIGKSYGVLCAVASKTTAL
ncbi:MAG: hypothetical protein ABI895_29230 [Deltaproteobacteria bacterium]